jgi:hypothetical protein
MIRSVPPATSIKAKVATGVSTATLLYASSLGAQRLAPALRDALGLTLGDGITATYPLRVALSLTLGALAAVLGPRRHVPEVWLAWITALALAIGVVLICVFP